MPQEDRHSGFTGYRRQRRTRLSVRLADSVARRLISLGGIGTIVAVSVVCAFLVYVVVPLFQSPEVDSQEILPTEVRAPRRLRMDEYQTQAWAFSQAGELSLLRLDTGKVMRRQSLSRDVALTSWSIGLDGETAIFGFADGTVKLGMARFSASPTAEPDLVQEHGNVPEGRVVEAQDKLLSRGPGGLRLHDFSLKLAEPLAVGDGHAIVLVDRAARAGGSLFAAMNDQGRVRVNVVRERENLITGEVTTQLSGGMFNLDISAGLPLEMLLSDSGDSVYFLWADGTLVRYDTRDLENPVLAERQNLLPDSGVRITTAGWLLGRSTLLVGDSSGTVRACFRIRDEASLANPDGWRVVVGHVLQGPQAEVTSMASSQRTRLVAIGYGNGQVRLLHITSGQLLLEVDVAGPVNALAIAPKEDALLALADGQLVRWQIDVKHPEASMPALFLPVWYEGAAGPEHVWQSSSGDDAFEPKLGLMPLIFGTLKATFYSLLFGVPLALLAAIYTSEFLHPKVRSKIKPTIELMASLPSVVLGFLAALVIAPFVERALPIILTALATIPTACLLGAFVWQLLPRHVALRLDHWRLLGMAAFLVLGALAAVWLAPLVESRLFAGDIKQWLNGQHGSGISGWLLLTVPLAAVLVGLLMSLVVNPLIRRRYGHLSNSRAAALDMVRFAVGLLLVAATAWMLAWLLQTVAWDPRGGASFLGTYVPRNAMIVGFIMGFAIIPIIYTIAEDALSTIPEHLRAGSLAAGATPWQTAIRIVVPTAMSGLFSAIMIGLGRAVGETMIVLMAGGNTPIMEWNVFNGIRTLSANIAVEMPEAPQGSTHYRTLFLAALVLFVITFLINTVAELVRLRFRRRAYQL